MPQRSAQQALLPARERSGSAVAPDEQLRGRLGPGFNCAGDGLSRHHGRAGAELDHLVLLDRLPVGGGAALPLRVLPLSHGDVVAGHAGRGAGRRRAFHRLNVCAHINFYKLAA